MVIRSKCGAQAMRMTCAFAVSAAALMLQCSAILADSAAPATESPAPTQTPTPPSEPQQAATPQPSLSPSSSPATGGSPSQAGGPSSATAPAQAPAADQPATPTAAPAAPPTLQPTPPTAPIQSSPSLLEPGPSPDDNSLLPAPAAPTLVGKIAKITLSGNKAISTDAIEAVMTQKVGAQFDETAAENDRDAIKGMGYFNGDVVLTTAADPAGGVDVTYTLVENPIIKKIVFTANTPTGEPTISSDKLKSMMDTKEGQVLNSNVFVHDIDRLFDHNTGYVASQGYIFDVSQDVNVDPNTNVLTIPLIETHIDHIVIKAQNGGKLKTKTFVVTREMRSKPGDVLNTNTLQKDETKIYNLGLFDQVGPWQPVATDIGKIDVVLPLSEKRSGQVSVGVGYSSRAKLVGRAELAENNFRGLGEHIAIQWEVDSIDTGQSVDLTFYEPYLDKHHTSADVDLFDRAVYRFSSDFFGATVGTNNIYIEQHKGASLGLHRPISPTLTVSANTRIETVNVDNVNLPPQDTFIRQNVSPLLGLGFGLTSNTRDNDISPASGGMLQPSVEFVTSSTTTASNVPGPLVPGEHDFVKLGLDVRRYMSLQGPRKPGDFKSPKKVFAVHLLLGYTSDDVPFSEQYFIGGADSLRSLITDRYWGSRLALMQAELRIPVGRNNDFQGVLFTDEGDAWGSLYQDSQLMQNNKFFLASDIGVGIRLVLPIGPIRLDYAVGTGGGQTQFSIGQSF